MSTRHVLEFLDDLWAGETGWVALPYKANERWRETKLFSWPQERELVVQHVRRRLEEKADLYFCPLIFTEPQRKKENLDSTQWLWADLDYADPKVIVPKPTIAWESSSGRYQALWKLRKPIPAVEASELSRRIAYHVGADTSGWDLTQVLRPPGSFNYKYDRPWRVELLWNRENRLYSRVGLEKMLPEAPGLSTELEVTPELPDTTARAVLREWRNSLSGRAVSLLKATARSVERIKDEDAEQGDRSKRLSELAHLLAEARKGSARMTPGEIVLLLQSSAWNKFDGRPDEMTRLWSTVNDAVAKHRVHLEYKRASEYKPRSPRWLWEPWVPQGRLEWLVGHTEVGKSTIAANIVSAFSNGGRMPDGQRLKKDHRGISVAIWTEDDIEDTVIPRLMAAGANMDRIILNPVVKDPMGRMSRFKFVEYQEALEELVAKEKKLKLIVFDPMAMFIGGKANKQSYAEVYDAEISPLAEFCSKHDVTILGLVHMNKRAGDRMLDRVMDSRAYTAGPRVILGAATGRDHRRFLGVIKNNIGPRAPSLEFELQGTMLSYKSEVEKSPTGEFLITFGEDVKANRIEWLAEDASVRVEDLVEQEVERESEKETEGQLEQAVEFLKETLSTKPMTSAKVFELAAAHGFSKKTVYRAKDNLKVLSRKQKGSRHGQWEWYLPE